MKKGGYGLIVVLVLLIFFVRYVRSHFDPIDISNFLEQYGISFVSFEDAGPGFGGGSSRGAGNGGRR